MSEPVIKLEDKKAIEPDITPKGDVDWEYLQDDESIREVLFNYAPKKGRLFRFGFSLDGNHTHHNNVDVMSFNRRYRKLAKHYERSISAAINMIDSCVDVIYDICYKAENEGFFSISYDTEINGHTQYVGPSMMSVIAALSSIADDTNNSIELGFGTSYGFYRCVYEILNNLFKSQQILEGSQSQYYRWLKNNPIDEIDDVIRDCGLDYCGEKLFKLRDVCIALRVAGMHSMANGIEQYESLDEMREERRKRLREVTEKAGRILSATEDSTEGRL